MIHPKSRSWLFLAHTLGTVALASLAACSSGDDTHVSTRHQLSVEQHAELDEWIGTALERYSIPGAAVAIVRGPDVIISGALVSAASRIGRR